MALNSGLWLPLEKPDNPELDPLDPINRGLVGFWPLGEGRGKVARDLCSPGNTGNFNGFGAYPWGAGRQGGQALVFDGAASYVVTANSLRVGSTFTIGGWVKLGAAATSYQRIFETAFASAFYLGTNTNGTKFDFIVNAAAGLETCIGGTPTIGKKQFVYGVYDGTTSFLYVDGLQVASVARTAPNTSLPLYFGRASGGSTQFWNGGMECARYFNRALSPSEIYRLYTEQWAGVLQDDTTDYRIAASGTAVTGTIATTEADDVLAATGSVQTVGTIATTEAPDVLAATGFLSFVGTIATTEANDTLAAAGKVLITGTAPLVEAGDVLAATGTVSQPAITGTIAVTESGDTFAARSPSAAGVQVLNYGVMRRRREEYERREEEEIARDIAASIEEGLPGPLKPSDEPEPAPPGAEALEAAALALSRVPAALATDETVTARIAAEIEARLRGVAPRSVAKSAIAAALDDYDDDEESMLALLLAA